MSEMEKISQPATTAYSALFSGEIEKLSLALSFSLSDKPKKTTTIISVAAMEGGGGTLSEIYQSAKKLLLRSRDGLERLERLEYSATADTGADTELSFAVKKDITQIQSLCVEMDSLWRSVAAKSQRDLWKR